MSSDEDEIDEDSLYQKILALNALESRLSGRIERVRHVAELLSNIRLVAGPDDELVYPQDMGTDQQMTEARRQEIYTSCIVAADELLAATEAEHDTEG